EYYCWLHYSGAQF
nr:immunoglobulin light chain junction region [Macaca mulatta]